MNVELEIVQVLRTAAEDLEAENLVEWKIPYDRILSIMRMLIQTGHLESIHGKIVLTAIGRIRLQAGMTLLAKPRAPQKTALEPTRLTAQFVVDYIPEKLVD